MQSQLQGTPSHRAAFVRLIVNPTKAIRPYRKDAIKLEPLGDVMILCISCVNFVPEREPYNFALHT